MFDNEINKINKYLKGQLWMDFEICSMDGARLEIYGFLDELDNNKMKLVFEQPYMVCCNFFFTYEGKKDFISIVDGKEAFQINKRYGVTQGNTIFKIFNTNIATDMFIIAKGIKVQIME